ncbi:hypothetical protein BLAT2472_50432 [Burkholderia latens]
MLYGITSAHTPIRPAIADDETTHPDRPFDRHSIAKMRQPDAWLTTNIISCLFWKPRCGAFGENAREAHGTATGTTAST